MSSFTQVATTQFPTQTLSVRPTLKSRFQIHTFDRTTDLKEIIAALKFNGGVRVKGFLNAEQVAAYDQRATTLLADLDFKDPADTTKRVTRLPLHMPELVEQVLTDELYLGVCDAVLTIDTRIWLGKRQMRLTETPVVQATTAFAVAPGTGAQDLHRDDGLYCNPLPECEPENYKVGRDKSISVFIAGRKTTRENGATNFIPGSHLQRTETPPDPSLAVPAELDAGDIFFMLASSYHGAGHNSTKDQERLVYGIFMMQAHLRQEENLYLAIPPEKVKQFPTSVQKRLGYDLAMPFLGWVDYESPIAAVLGGEAAAELVLTYESTTTD